MDINAYALLALRTANNLGPEGDLIHATLLVTSEGGEIADVVKKHFAYGKELNKLAIKEEVGDLLWGVNLLLHTVGLSWEDVLAGNIAKLEKRYPDLRFNAEHATNRNKELELQAVQNAQAQ